MEKLNKNQATKLMLSLICERINAKFTTFQKQIRKQVPIQFYRGQHYSDTKTR